MDRLIKMTKAEYERFCEFRGAENTVKSLQTQMRMQDLEYQGLADAILSAFDMRIDGSEVIVLDVAAAVQAIRLAAELQR